MSQALISTTSDRYGGVQPAQAQGAILLTPPSLACCVNPGKSLYQLWAIPQFKL